MSKFIYSVWFLDTEAADDDQGREWIACIGIEAGSEEEAQGWGDTLARERAQRSRQDIFLRSCVEQESEVGEVTDWSSLPRIKAGEAAAQDVIGW